MSEADQIQNEIKNSIVAPCPINIATVNRVFKRDPMVTKMNLSQIQKIYKSKFCGQILLRRKVKLKFNMSP